MWNHPKQCSLCHSQMEASANQCKFGLLVGLIDHVYSVPGLQWLGTCNELNGAYAADGYARIKEMPGVILTTYAVGELSAMNGVAGAYAEHAGMIHIVGMPSRARKKPQILTIQLF